MTGKVQNGMPCNEFEALLSDALDGALSGPAQERFEAHRQSCLVCRLSFAETKAGMEWLQGLEEVEAPRQLLHNILAVTSAADAAATAAQPGWRERLRGWIGPALQPALQPRFAMSFAMAFFSITLVLNIVGVRFSELRAADFRPKSLLNTAVETVAETQGRVVKYYENLRFVYEIESRVRQLKNATDQNTQPDDNTQKDKKPKDDNTSGQPQRHEERYSLGFEEGILASVAAPWNCDSVWAVLDRRNP